MKIERVTVADAEELLAIYTPYVEKTAITFEYEVPTVADFEERIRQTSARYPYLKAVEDGKIVGYAYAGTFKGRKAYDWAVETTIYVKEDARRAGVGRALYEVLEKSLAGMGILNMNACIASPIVPDETLNDDSIRFHKRMGFAPVGTFHECGYKFDRWYDMIWMEKMIGEHKAPGDVKFGKWEL